MNLLFAVLMLRNSWLLTGDSLTEQLFNVPGYTNIGKSGLLTSDAVQEERMWFAQYPTNVVTFSFGTNDIYLQPCNPKEYTENILRLIITAKYYDKQVFIPTIATPKSACLDSLNAQLRKIYKFYPEVRGPDLYAFFDQHPELLATNVHPNQKGYDELKRIWINFKKQKEDKGAL